MATERQFIALPVAVLTISDSRTEDTDTSGRALVTKLMEAGHRLQDKKIVRDDIYQIRAIVAGWIASTDISVILTTGGTGVTGRDGTPEAISVLLDKELDGFGEMFRVLSYAQIQTSTLQSRALAGVANATYIFCLPGSPSACTLAWDSLISQQLDYRTRPCNLVELMPRLLEK
jgi:molybdopterin adenylyltransferase